MTRTRVGGIWRSITGVICLAMLFAGVLVATSAGAVNTTVVSLTFDNDILSQYTLGFQQALQPHGMNATFYVNSGTVGHASTLSWAQLSLARRRG